MITEKEREVQEALGLCSDYYIQTETHRDHFNGGGIFHAVSVEDTVQQFIDQLSIGPFFTPEHIKRAILQDINEGHYKIEILPRAI